MKVAALSLGVLLLALTASLAHAAGFGVTVHQIDVSQFPRVRVSVSVADGMGVPITGLDAQAFEVKEDDQPVSGLRVESVVESQEPVATALIIDISGSMAEDDKIGSARNAATAFVDTLGARDSAALISFADEVKVVQPYTGDRAALKSAIAALQEGGETSLYDAIGQTAQLQGALPQRRKVLVVLSDGADSRSRSTLEATLAAAQSAGVVVFAIGFGDDVNHEVLDRLAGPSGQSVYVTEPEQLRQAFLSIGDRLRRQYVLEYQSRQAADDRPHSVSVRSTYRGQSAEASGRFAPPRVPIVLDVRGITSASRVSGPQQIEVTVSAGQPRQVELFVDDQSRGAMSAPPFTFQWDTQREAPGLHRVVVRATEDGGATTEREVVLEVVSPAPTGAVTAAPVAGSTPGSVTPPVSSGSVAPANDRLGLIIGGAALLAIVIGVGLVFAIARSGPKRPDHVPPPQVPSDRTVVIGADAAALTGLTQVGMRAQVAVRPPRARVVVGPGREITLEPTMETTIGRDASSTIPIPPTDQQASRHHARIVSEGDAYYVEDMKSMNGTRVNGEPVASRRKLASKDQISVGETVLTFVVEGARGE